MHAMFTPAPRYRRRRPAGRRRWRHRGPGSPADRGPLERHDGRPSRAPTSASASRR